MASNNSNLSSYSTFIENTNNQYFKFSVNSSQKQLPVYNISKVTTIFFDLDNTLIPTRSGDTKACRKVSKCLEIQYGFTKKEANLATQNFLESFRRCPNNIDKPLDNWRIHLWRESLPLKYKQLAEEIYPLWLELRYCYLAIPDDGIQMLIRFRQANYKLALITNGPSKAQWEKIRKLNVQHHFDCVLVSADLPWEKPNPNIFFTACKYLKVSPQQCAMIGDKLESDIKGGNLAGLAATFWLPTTDEAVQSLSDDINCKPTHKLRNLLELYKYFNIREQKVNEKVPVYNSQGNKCRRAGVLPTFDNWISNETDNSSENSSNSINEITGTIY